MRNKIFVMLICSLILVGCDRTIESRNPVRSLSGKPPTPNNLNAAVDSESVSLTWKISNAANVQRYRIYQSNFPDSLFILVDSTSSNIENITISGLTTNQDYQFTIAAVGSSGIEGDRSAEIVVRVAPMSIVINSDAEFTGRRDVQLKLTAPAGVSLVIISEDSAMLTNENAESFTTTKNFVLSAGDGVKTVYARYLFAGGTSSGTPLFDDIVLDSRAAIDSVFFAPSGTQFSSGDKITFSLLSNGGELNGTASISIIGVPSITLFDDGLNGDIVANDGQYSVDYIVPTDLNVDDATVTGKFSDAAGNVAPQRTAPDRISIIGSPPPTAVVLAVVINVDTLIELSWSQYTGDNFFNYQLLLDTLPPVNADSLDFATAQLIKIINSKTIATFTDFRSAADTYYYQIYVHDTFGRSAGSNVVSITKQ